MKPANRIANGNGNRNGNGKRRAPVLVPRANGRGALRRGNPGNKGGTGRPPSELRAAMRGSLWDRLHIAEEIADDPDNSPADRLRALDFMAKYGLGTRTEIGGDDTEHLPLTIHLVSDPRP